MLSRTMGGIGVMCSLNVVHLFLMVSSKWLLIRCIPSVCQLDVGSDKLFLICFVKDTLGTMAFH